MSKPNLRSFFSLSDIVSTSQKYCRRPVCIPSKDVYHRGELLGGFIIESPDERDGVHISLDRVEVKVRDKRIKMLSLLFSLSWVRSRIPPNVIGISSILVIPVEGFIDEVLVIKEGEVSQQIKPVGDFWNTTIYGRRAEIAIERFIEYPSVPEDFDEEYLEYYHVVRVKII